MKRRTLLQAGSLLPLLNGVTLARAVAQPTPSGPASGLSGKVTMHNGRATLFLNDRPVYPMIYSLTDTPGGRWTWEEIGRENIENFTQAGIKLIQVDIWLEYIWAPDGKMDMALVHRQIRGALAVNPDAAISIRLHVNAPAWWNKANPDEITQYANGPVADIPMRGLQRLLENDLERTPRASMASLKWREEAGAKLREFCEALAPSPEGASVYSIHPCSGVYHEWHYWGFIEHDPDTGARMTEFFRQWLTEKYKTDAALQAAWAMPMVRLATAAVPGVAERRATSDGLFRDPVKERQVSDYFECHHLTITDSIIHFCSIAKQSWNRPLVTGVFYGYFFVLFGRQQTGGHLQLQKVLNSPWVDYLSAPIAYGKAFRDVGGSGQPRGLPESMRLHGKLLLDEMDQEPPSFGKEPKLSASLLGDSVATLRRNLAQAHSQGHGLWFYDFGPGRASKGWWDDATLMREVAAMRDLFGRYYEKPYAPQADVALVYDTDSFYHTAAYGDQDPVIGPQLVDSLPVHAYRSGAALDIFHLGDLERAEWGRYKCVVFANCFLLTDAQKAFIRRRVARDGRHIVWIMAPGYNDGARIDAGLRIAAGKYTRCLQARDMRAIPDGAIDAVISSYFWEHMAPADKPLILDEIRRVLKPGGKIIFVFDVATKNPLITWMRKARPELYQSLFIDSDGHLGYETADENDALIRKHGFRITRSFPMERTPLQSTSVYSKLQDWPGPLRWVGRGLSILNRQPLLHLYTALLRLIDETLGRFFPRSWGRITIVVAEKGT